MRWFKLKVIGLLGVGIALVMLALTQIIPSFINGEPIAERIGARVKELTGEPFVFGELTVSILKSQLIFEGVAIKNPPGTTSNYFMRADELVIDVSLLDVLLGSEPKIETIELVAPRIELERIDEDRNNWSFLRRPRDESATAEDISVLISQGEVIYTDQQEGIVRNLKSLSGDVRVTLGQVAMNLSGVYEDVPSTVSGACRFEKFRHLGSFDSDCVIAITQDKSQVELSGRFILENDSVVAKYKTKIDSTDARFWGDVLLGDAGKPFTNYYNAELAVKLQAESYFDATRSIINISEFQVGKSKGKASVSIAAGETGDQGTTSIWFDYLDYDDFTSGVTDSIGGADDPFARKEGFDETLASNITMRAAKINFHGVELTNFAATGQLGGGSITVTDARAATPANGTLVTFGRIGTTEEGLSYEGQVEAHGDSLYALAPMMGVGKEDVPEGIFTQFRTRFNLIIRAKSMTLSELRMITGNDIRIAGGINFFNESAAARKIDATLAIKNIDFAPMERLWLKDASLLSPPDQLTYNPYAFEWLKTLDRYIDIQLELDNFKVGGMEGRASSVLVKVKPNELELSNIKMLLDGSQVQGTASLTHEPSRPRPVIAAKLNISRLNLGNVLRESIWAKEQRSAQDSVWSREPINFYPLHHFDGTAELRIRQLEHEKFRANNVRALVQLADTQLTMKEAKALIWGGEMKMDLTVDSLVVPGMTITFSVLNGQIRDFMESFVDFDQLAGLISMQGSIRFSGINFESWIDNIQGHYTIDARNVFIQDFNLPAVIRSIESTRAVAGLLNAIRTSFSGGSTRIGNVNGTTYLSKGTMQTTRVTFRSNESVGELEGKINLRKWTMEMAAKFGLVTLAQTSYPVLMVTLEGPAEMPVHGLNTKSVEAFLAQRLR